MKPIRAPKGYRFEVEMFDDDIYVNLRFGPRVVGVLRLESVYTPFRGRAGRRFITHSQLRYEHHCKGLGVLMYAKAIQYCKENGYKVSSSYMPSEAAKRVWQSKSIRKYFNVRLYGGVYVPMKKAA